VSRWPPDQDLWATLADTPDRIRAYLAGMRCVSSWQNLRNRLGEPETILCLGNGPSSEGDGIEGVSFDCLFRVNWIWNERSVHRDPNVVFTADLDVPSASTVPIICFPTREDANRILAGYVRRRVGASTQYLVFPELPSPFRDRTWSYRPTNGALMVAAAVLLRPSHLIIAGIDLYRHPAGRYPGATLELNRYDDIHHRDTDLAFIRLALDRFGGDTTILSEPLRSALLTSNSGSDGPGDDDRL
jgi:hypothetical protein